MSSPLALHVVARVKRDRVAALARLLEEMHANPAGNALLPFGRLQQLHFGRLLLLPPALASGSPILPATLVLSTTFDGELGDHLEDLLRVGGEGLDRIFEHCQDYPSASGRTPAARRAFLERRRSPVNAFYANTAGRRVRQVERDAALCRAIDGFLDRERPRMQGAGASARDVRDDVVTFVGSSEEHAWSLQPVPGEPGRVRAVLFIAAVAAAALASLGTVVLFPWLLVAVLGFALLLRAHERADVPDNFRPADARLAALERDEDLGVQNQLTAIGYLQRGPFRRLLARVLLWVLDLGSRNLFYRGQLAGVTTIHAARWVMMDGGRRVIFESNYDGSPESYQDDFIGIAFGLNLVFSNGRGWPRTRWLLFGGASDEQPFRAYYRDHQTRTQVWFAAPAYRDLTAVNVARNARIRRGLCEPLAGAELDAWVRAL